MASSHSAALRRFAVALALLGVLAAGACTESPDGPATTIASGDASDGGSASTTSLPPASTTNPSSTSTSTSTIAAAREWDQVTCENGVVVSYEVPADGTSLSIDDLCSDVDEGEPTPLLDFCGDWWPESDIVPCLDAGEELFFACLAEADPAAGEPLAMGFVVDCLTAGEELLAGDELFGMCGPDHLPVVTDDGTTCVPVVASDGAEDE